MAFKVTKADPRQPYAALILETNGDAGELLHILRRGLSACENSVNQYPDIKKLITELKDYRSRNCM